MSTVKEASSAWLTARPAQPILPLGLQTLLALAAGLLVLLGSSIFLTAGKRSTGVSLASALVASVAIGFGSVFVVNAVHVYTG